MTKVIPRSAKLVRLPPRLTPAKFDDELSRIIERLRWANSVPEIVNIDEQAEGLEAAVKLFRLGWEAQREAALLRLKCLFHIYGILQQPRAPVGRPPTKKIILHGTILKPTVAQLRCPPTLYKTYGPPRPQEACAR